MSKRTPKKRAVVRRPKPPVAEVVEQAFGDGGIWPPGGGEFWPPTQVAKLMKDRAIRENNHVAALAYAVLILSQTLGDLATVMRGKP